MRNPSNPSSEDIRRWAFDAGAEEPVQDWDLLLSTVAQENFFLELASNDDCPKSEFFLALLYLITGDAVRTDYKSHRRDAIESWRRRLRRIIPSAAFTFGFEGQSI
jgi:hypothetical protein